MFTLRAIENVMSTFIELSLHHMIDCKALEVGLDLCFCFMSRSTARAILRQVV